MPFESNKQRKAMYAAAQGSSNIGIPKSVAKKFIRDSAFSKTHKMRNKRKAT